MVLALALLTVLPSFGQDKKPAEKNQAVEAAKDKDADLITADAAKAIEAGLEYLAKEQAADGSWGTGEYAGSPAVTSLAGLAFLAGGHQPGKGQHGDVLTKAIDFVLSHEDPKLPGLFGGKKHGPMYNHGFAVLFLAEAHEIIANPQQKHRIQKALERGVALTLKAQNIEGGWRYTPVSQDADVTGTSCQLVALCAAWRAGIDIPKTALDRSIRYVKECQNGNFGDGGFFYQRGGSARFSRFPRSAAAVLALQRGGADHNKDVDKALEYLFRFKPGNRNNEVDAESKLYFYYGQYYAAQAMWAAGGKYRAEWYPAIREELLRPASDGGRREKNSWVDTAIDAHFGTAAALIILQIPRNSVKEKAEDQAIAFVKKLGGSVVRDNFLDRPVIQVGLAGKNVTNADLKELAPFRRLQVLQLDGTRVNDTGLKDLAPFKNLQSLSVSQAKVGDAGLKELASLKNLKTLDLSQTQVSDAGLKELAALPSLHTLLLGQARVGDAGVKELAALRSLRDLSLSETRVGDAGLKELGPLSRLKRLALAGTQLTDGGAKELVAFEELESLDLAKTRVSDAGLKQVAALKELRFLVLDGTRVTDVGLKEMVGLGRLEYLGLADTKVTDAGVVELGRALPKLKVRR